jgi:hypothetical protein
MPKSRFRAESVCAVCVTTWQSLVSGGESSTGQQLVIVPK